MYSISFSKQAHKALRKMPRNWSFKIAEKIKQLSRDPEKFANVKKLTDHPGYRLRVGDWRIVYLIDKDEKNIQVVKIKPRGGVYK